MEKDTKQFLHYAGALFLTVAAFAVIWQMFGPSWFKNIKAEVTNRPFDRTITVDGEGKITAPPDVALLSLSVVSQAATVKDVTKDGNTKMATLNQALKKLGIEDKDLTTSEYNLIPQYSKTEPIVLPMAQPMTPEFSTSDTQPPKIIGYNLNQTLQVKVRKLDMVDDVLDAALQAGANQIGQLSFSIDDPSDYKQQAREKAFEAARKKAEQMSAAAGVKLGQVVTFSEGYNYVPYSNFSLNAMAKTADMQATPAPAPTLQPGSEEINLNVSVTYEIE